MEEYEREHRRRVEKGDPLEILLTTAKNIDLISYTQSRLPSASHVVPQDFLEEWRSEVMAAVQTLYQKLS